VKQRPVSDVEAYTSGRMGNQEGTYCNPRAAMNIIRFNISLFYVMLLNICYPDAYIVIGLF
jgi:hypothetical protein